MVIRNILKHIGIILLFFALLELFSGVSPEKPTRIVRNYRACVGIDYDGRIDYSWLEANYGEPASIEVIEPYGNIYWYRIYVNYDSLSFMFSADDEEEFNDRYSWTLGNITTKDPGHYFTKHRVHVGSSRDDVIAAYKKAFTREGDILGDRYIDGLFMDCFVNFTYDENDLVTSINFDYRM